jgi:hypothetical protein
MRWNGRTAPSSDPGDPLRPRVDAAAVAPEAADQRDADLPGHLHGQGRRRRHGREHRDARLILDAEAISHLDATAAETLATRGVSGADTGRADRGRRPPTPGRALGARCAAFKTRDLDSLIA